MTAPDLDQARKFLELLDPDTEVFTFQTFDDDSRLKRGRLAKVLHGSLDELAPQLADLQKSGAGVFVTINATDLQGRTAENIKRVRAVFADLDGAPVQPVLSCGLEPHVIVESSPGRFHAYWMAHRLPLDRFGAVQKVIIARFGSDKSVHDLPRVMRLPGFTHQKGEPFRTRIHQVAERLPYTPDDICNEFRALEEPSEAKPNGHDPASLDDLRKALTGETPHAWHSAMVSMIAHLVGHGAEDWFILDWAAQYRWQGYTLDATRRDVQKMIDGARAKGWTPEQPADIAFTLLCNVKPNLDHNDIVAGLIPRRAFGEVHADSTGGKTAILVDLLLHVAAGLDYRGRRTDQQPVVYVCFEGLGGIDNRVHAAARHLGIADAPFALVKITTSFKDPEVAKQVADIAGRLSRTFGGDCPVIAIDTYQAALGSGASDCDPRDVTAFITNVQQHLLTTCTVIIAHHFGKDQSRGGRGWSGLRAALDFELEIDHDTDTDLRTMRVTKSRDGSDRQPAMCYRFHGYEVGKNKHDEPVTAVVVEHLADEDAAKRGKRHSPKARAALNIMWEMIKDRSRSFPIPDQPGLRCVILGDWEQACIAPDAICKCSTEPDRRKKFNAAKQELEKAQAITVEGGRVYPTPKRTERDD